MTERARDPGEPDFEEEWKSLVARLESDEMADGPWPHDDEFAKRDDVDADTSDDDVSHENDATDWELWSGGPDDDAPAGYGFATNRQWSPGGPTDDEESFIPPEPPPLGWLDSPPLLVLCWLGAICAPLYAVVVVLFWHGAPGFTILIAIVAFIAGVTGLIISMPDHRDSDDDGAVI